MTDPCANCGKRHRVLTTDQCVDRSMSEETLTKRVLYRAHRDGWERAHAGRAYIPQGEGQEPLIITPMAAGWPDWTFAKPGHHVLFVELKKELGEISEDQAKWLSLLNRTGNFALIVRPSDLREGRVDAIFRRGAPL